MTAHNSGRTVAGQGRMRARAAGVLALSIATGGCLALVSRAPLTPLRAVTRWSLEWRGARFIAQDGARLQSSLNDCGPAALADFLELTGRAVPSADSMKRLTATDQHGTTLANLEAAAVASGLRVFSVRWDPGELALLPLPSLVWVERRHFVVVARRSGADSVEIHDPAAGRYRMTVDRFARSWSGEALIPLDSISPPPPAGRSVRRAAPSPAGDAGTPIQNDGGLA
ncbi:MAG: cysteine peptidase family C39 domain-containing protein [Gemmatimonadales bacterium]